MTLFVLCIVCLWVASFKRTGPVCFAREKTAPLRGILAILVVAHHLSLETGCLSAFVPWGAPIVSLFLFMSGYGLMVSLLTKGDNYLRGFVRRRIGLSLFLPFAIAWALYRLLNASSTPSLAREATDLLLHGIPVLPHSWYIFTALLFTFTFYGLSKYMRRTMLYTLPLFCLGYVAITARAGYDRCWYISALAFAAGVWYARYERSVTAFWHRPTAYYTTVPACLTVMAACVWLHNETAYLVFYCVFPLSMVCVFAKVNIERLNRIRIFRCLGNISYEVYLCQGIAMSMLRNEFFEIKSDNWYILCTFITTFALALTIRQLTLRLQQCLK